VKHTNKVTGFVGGAKTIAPISESDVQKIVNQMQVGTESHATRWNSRLVNMCVSGWTIHRLNGTVEEVNYDKTRCV
jgi:transcriptional antiterminator NusG